MIDVYIAVEVDSADHKAFSQQSTPVLGSRPSFVNSTYSLSRQE